MKVSSGGKFNDNNQGERDRRSYCLRRLSTSLHDSLLDEDACSSSAKRMFTLHVVLLLQRERLARRQFLQLRTGHPFVVLLYGLICH
jgi:hypothetical protein